MLLGRRRRRPAAAMAAPAAGGASQPGGATPGLPVIPYDYAARFTLKGIPGNIVQDVINVGPDGVFVATAISYGFEPERAAGELGRRFEPEPGQTLVLPGSIRLSALPVDALIQGFRVNPKVDQLVFPPAAATGGPAAQPDFSDTPGQGVPPDFTGQLFERMKPPAPVSFLFNFVDTGTGREMQDVPVHNLASLGIANGERPFRQLARPVSFLPRSNLRLQVIEQSLDTVGTLFIVLSGYMVLGARGMSEQEARTLAMRTAPPPAPPQGPVVPFDYVTTFELTGRPGNLVSDEIAINVEGGYMATAIGYGVALPETRVEPRNLVFPAQGNQTFNLGEQRLRIFTPDALRDGIRIRPQMIRIAFSSSNSLSASVPASLAGQLFERLNRSEDVSFRYRIHDTARGRDLQNEPINNIAGLGIADGSRPFRILTRAFHAEPRSTLQVTVEERNGRGRLYIVFQGYKILGGRG